MLLNNDWSTLRRFEAEEDWCRAEGINMASKRMVALARRINTWLRDLTEVYTRSAEVTMRDFEIAYWERVARLNTLQSLYDKWLLMGKDPTSVPMQHLWLRMTRLEDVLIDWGYPTRDAPVPDDLKQRRAALRSFYDDLVDAGERPTSAIMAPFEKRLADLERRILAYRPRSFQPLPPRPR